MNLKICVFLEQLSEYKNHVEKLKLELQYSRYKTCFKSKYGVDGSSLLTALQRYYGLNLNFNLLLLCQILKFPVRKLDLFYYHAQINK